MNDESIIFSGESLGVNVDVSGTTEVDVSASLPSFTKEVELDAESTTDVNFSTSASTIQVDISMGEGGGGVTIHNALTGRDENECHPISAITNLQDTLNNKQHTLTAGTNISITDNTISATDTKPVWGNITGTLSSQSDLATALLNKQNVLTAGSNIQISGSTISATDTTYNDATTTTHGLMSTTDKSKLDGIASGAEVNVQSNWTETDTTSDAYIQNKPTNLETTTNKVTSLSSSSTNTQYPSAKSVVDYVAENTPPSIYQVTVNSTTFAQITDALTNNKLPIINPVASETYGTYVYNGRTVTDDVASYVFVYVRNNTAYMYSVNENDVWTQSSTELQGTADKTDTVATYSSSSTMYPSTKGVVDYITSVMPEGALYVCTYGSTTYEQISAALQGNKLPYVISEYVNYFYVGREQWTIDGVTYHIYDFVNTSQPQNPIWPEINEYAVCKMCQCWDQAYEGSTWRKYSNSLEVTSDKTDTISGSGSNVKYPSTKGVVDYVTPLLANKQDTLIAGTNIDITSNTISATDTTYSAGTNITIDANNEISATNTTYSAGTNITIDENNEISASDTTYTAGANVSISDQNVISATDTTYTAGTNITISANNEISSTASGDFYWCTFDVTTVAEVEEALADNKLPVLSYSGKIYQFTYKYDAGGRIYYTFQNIYSNSMYWIQLSQSTSSEEESWYVWPTAFVLQLISDRTDDISAYPTSSQKYPSTKGVVDYVTPLISAKQDTLTAGSGITITNNVISAPASVPELYSCTYGTTTYALITTAVSEGKIPWVSYGDSFYIYSTTDDSTSGSEYHIFYSINKTTCMWVKVDVEDAWTSGSFTVENTANKVTSITSYSTTEYPSVSALRSYVEDALAGKQDTLTAGNNVTISGNTISATDTTYSPFVGSGATAASGLVPAPSTTAGTTKYLCEDGNWSVPASGIFWATYDTTSASDIYTAYAANKLVLVNWSGQIFQLYMAADQGSGEYVAMFCGIYSTASLIIYAQESSGTTTWSYSTSHLQNANYKTSDIDSYSTSTAYYPTTKGVVDYVTTQVGTETTRAQTAETNLQTNITNEATTRSTADTNLQTNITTEVNRATAAEATKENVANKVTTITGNESSTTYYPTTKAVADYVAGYKELYWCTYGTTTGPEIETAVNNGLLPVLKIGGIIYAYVSKATTTSSNIYNFGASEMNSCLTVIVTYDTTEQTTSWNSYTYLLEQSNFKKNTITGYTSSSVCYPTTKAVADYVKLFSCTYGTTTSTEIEAALTAGKMPIVYYDGYASTSSYKNAWYTYAYKYVYGSNTYYYFTHPGSSNAHYSVYLISYTSGSTTTETWGTLTYSLIPYSFLKTTITGYETSTTYIPCTKAVVDYVKLFSCTYGTTTYAEITTAKTAGKIPFFFYNGYLFTYTGTETLTSSSSDSVHMFKASTSSGTLRAYVNSSDTWANDKEGWVYLGTVPVPDGNNAGLTLDMSRYSEIAVQGDYTVGSTTLSSLCLGITLTSSSSIFNISATLSSGKTASNTYMLHGKGESMPRYDASTPVGLAKMTINYGSYGMLYLDAEIDGYIGYGDVSNITKIYWRQTGSTALEADSLSASNIKVYGRI